MKKILIPLLMGMLCSPVIAEDIHGMMRAMGYNDPSLFELIPKQKFVPPPPQKTEVITFDLDTKISPPGITAEDFLQPRVYSEAESAQMIPYLLKLHKQNPTSALLTRKLATTCLKNGQPREALYWYLQTYQRDRSDLESLWNMAVLAYQLGETEQTQKYLKEYAAQDPNSVWGRLAKDFLAGRFSGTSMEKAFKSEFSHFGHFGGGVTKNSEQPQKSKNQTSGGGILIIEGKRTTLEKFVGSYQPQKAAEPVSLKDTLKGKSEKSIKPAVEKDRILKKFAKPSPANANEVDIKSVTIVGEPLQ